MNTKSKTLIINKEEIDYLVNDGAIEISRNDAKSVIKNLYDKMLRRKGYRNFNLAFA